MATYTSDFTLGILTWSPSEKRQELNQVFPMSTQRYPSTPCLAKLASGCLAFPYWHFLLKLHLVHFEDKFFLAMQGHLHRSCLPSAPHAGETTPEFMFNFISHGKLGSVNLNRNSGVLETGLVEFSSLISKLHLKIKYMEYFFEVQNIDAGSGIIVNGLVLQTTKCHY